MKNLLETVPYMKLLSNWGADDLFKYRQLLEPHLELNQNANDWYSVAIAYGVGILQGKHEERQHQKQKVLAQIIRDIEILETLKKKDVAPIVTVQTSKGNTTLNYSNILNHISQEEHLISYLSGIMNNQNSLPKNKVACNGEQ